MFHESLNVANGKDPPHQLSHPMRNLTFNTQYRMRVYAYNDKDPTKEGVAYSFTFQTPPAGQFNVAEEIGKRIIINCLIFL